eukprot:8926612-Pyramimonas_sp.AAC.1
MRWRMANLTRTTERNNNVSMMAYPWRPMGTNNNVARRSELRRRMKILTRTRVMRVTGEWGRWGRTGSNG